MLITFFQLHADLDSLSSIRFGWPPVKLKVIYKCCAGLKLKLSVLGYEPKH